MLVGENESSDTKCYVETLCYKPEPWSLNDLCVNHAGLQMRNVGSSPIEFTQEDLLNKYENHVPLQPRFVAA